MSDDGRPEPVDMVTVRCMGYAVDASNRPCGTNYTASLRAFRKRTSTCPRCGDSKAQLRSDVRPPE